MDEHIKGQLEILNQQIKELIGIYHHAAVKSGISDNEFWVWYTILILGELYSQQDISDMWSLPKQTVNSVVANLNKKGYVFLEVVPGTRNRKIIRLTESGRKFGENIIAPIYEAERWSIEKMSEEERQTCIVLLEKYIGLLRKAFQEV